MIPSKSDSGVAYKFDLSNAGSSLPERENTAASHSCGLGQEIAHDHWKAFGLRSLVQVVPKVEVGPLSLFPTS